MEIRIYRCFRQYRQCFFLAAYCGFCLGSSVPDIPDRFRQGLPSFTFCTQTAVWALGAVPYLIVALFCKREGGIGGGDIKLAREQPAWYWDPCKSNCFLFRTDRICDVWLLDLPVESVQGKRDKEAFPVGPFLAGGAAAVYCMRLGG